LHDHIRLIVSVNRSDQHVVDHRQISAWGVVMIIIIIIIVLMTMVSVMIAPTVPTPNTGARSVPLLVAIVIGFSAAARPPWLRTALKNHGQREAHGENKTVQNTEFLHCFGKST